MDQLLDVSTARLVQTPVAVTQMFPGTFHAQKCFHKFLSSLDQQRHIEVFQAIQMLNIRNNQLVIL